MSPDLTSRKCEACDANAPRATPEQVAELKAAIPDWNITEVDSVARLERVFSFPNFARALAFTDAVGALAEEEGHHPRLVTEWGRTTVSWWTHKIKGLHVNDFIMAAKTDNAFARCGSGTSQ